MTRRLARLSLRFALWAANDELQHLWRGLGYMAGYRDARRQSIRALFPRATNRQLDRILADTTKEAPID